MKNDDEVKQAAFNLLRFLINGIIVWFFVIIWMLALQLSGGNALLGASICVLLFVSLGAANANLYDLKKALFPKSDPIKDGKVKEK